MMGLTPRFGRTRSSAWATVRFPRTVLFVLVLASAFPNALLADGKLFAPRNYEGSLEERSQEAIIIFTHDPSVNQSGFEHLILKLTVEGSVDNFAWVVPFPSEPKVEKEDAKLFAELFRYVQLRSVRRSRGGRGGEKTKAEADEPKTAEVDVLSRKTVGTYDVAIVRENQAGALNRWLEKEGFRTVEGGDDVLEFYRSKGYVLACIKIADTALAEKKTVDLHPLRFSFATGGYDGIYFPMKLTGLQENGFLVNLYVFYGAWLNDDINDFGFEHRGLRLVFRDYDGPNCDPNAGKLWAAPESDPYLSPLAPQLSTTAKLFTKLEPDQKFYLTNLQGGFKPAVVRQWKDDLWLFPYYTDDSMVPYDARPDGPAAALYASVTPRTRRAWWRHTAVWTAGVFLAGIAVGVFLPAAIRRFRRKPSPLTQA